jgi:hypothetical protein
LRIVGKLLHLRAMKLVLAIAVFGLFGLAIGGGILMLMHGSPWLFIVGMLAFLGTFAKYGCASQ